MSVLIKGVKMPKEGCKDCVLVMRKSVYDYCPILKQEVSGNVERGGRPAKCPLVEVPERKVGKWVHGREIAREMIGDCITSVFYEDWKCSECGCIVEEERKPLWKYCPNCGAEMEGASVDRSMSI